jgi:hypothetical protein
MTPTERDAAISTAIASIRAEPGVWTAAALREDLDLTESQWRSVRLGLHRFYKAQGPSGTYWPTRENGPTEVVIAIVKGMPYATRAEFAKRMGVSVRTMTIFLSDCVKLGHLITVKDGNSVRYRVP